ncbi:MAG: hypothetical protein AAGF11_55575 [Myxococcota bacterium]
MLRPLLRLCVLLGLAITFIAAFPAHAAASTCDDQLTELSNMEAALAQFEQAVATGEAQRDALRAEAHTLALAIADKHREGAEPAVIDRMQTQRREVLAELERREALTPVIVQQRDALVHAVDTARRGYITCVEASIDG